MKKLYTMRHLHGGMRPNSLLVRWKKTMTESESVRTISSTSLCVLTRSVWVHTDYSPAPMITSYSHKLRTR